MELIQIENDMTTAVNKIEEIGTLYAEAKGVSYQMQKQREVVLAREMKEHGGSNANQKTEALASDRYVEHIKGTGEAIELETKLKAQLERWKAQYEACRSLLSLEKAKVNLR